MGDANLILTIGGGVGYLVGDTQPTHQVALTPPPVVDFASGGPTYVAHGDRTSGNAVQIQVDLSPAVPAGETLDVDWSFDNTFAAGAPVCPNADVDGTTTTCTTNVPEDANSFEIVFNSDATSNVNNVGESLAINLEDAVGYTLGTPTLHIVEISQPDSAADFVAASSRVRAGGGQVLIPVGLAVQVDADAQPVTISWSFTDSQNAYNPICERDGTRDSFTSASGNCESVVAAGRQQATITVNSDARSTAGNADLVLDIIEGNGYNIGTRRQHQVALFAAPAAPEASFDAADSTLEHGDATGTIGGQVLVQLNLTGTSLPEYRIQWRFDAHANNHPFEFDCTPVGGGDATPIDGNDRRGDCESVVAAGENSVNIVINSDPSSSRNDIGDALTLSIVASDEYTRGTIVHQVNIIAAAAPPQVGFTAGAAEVFWGRDLEISVTLSPPLSTNPAVALPFNFFATGFADDWVSEVDADNVLACAGTSCDLTDPNETQSPIEATVQFTQNAALTPGPSTVTVSLANDAYLTAINDAAVDDTYIFGNQLLVVNVINPTVSRTTPDAIEISEGASADVIFTRAPIIGSGNSFAVGVGFPDTNGAEAADIESIFINGTDCGDLSAATPPISCTGNFGDTIAALTVSIAIAEDFELNESQELIVLSLQAQNAHDINPAAGLLATVTIVNVNPQVGFANAPPNIFWGQAIAPLVEVNPASPRAVGVSVLAAATAGAIVNLLPNVNPDPAVGTTQCAAVDGQRRCQIAALAQGNTTPDTANSLQTGPFGGYELTLILDDASVSDAQGQIYAPTPAAATLTISVSRYTVTMAVANAPSDSDGFQSGEEGVIQILDNDAEAGGVPSWADGDFSVAISITGGIEGTNWEVRTERENLAGVAQGAVIDECNIGCGIAWTDTTNGANAYLRILEQTEATVISVFLLNVPSAATSPSATPGAIIAVDFAVAAPVADIRVVAESASSSQVKGYLATIAFALGTPAAADTTGELIVTFADGILDDEVSGVVSEGAVAGDFTCDSATDTCVHTFAEEDDGAESLSLVLSLAIGGDVDDVQMAFSGEVSDYAVTASDINLTRTNYTVTFAAADQIPDLTEGAAADAFDLSVTPQLANDITITLRLEADDAAPADALDADDVVLLRTSDDAAITCTDATGTEANQILDCTLIALGVNGLDVAAAPTGTSAHGFSIGAVDDVFVDGIGVQARPIAGVGYDIPATDSDPSTNTDDFTILDSVGEGALIADFTEVSSNVRAEGGRIVIPVGLGAIVPEATSEGIDVVWTYNGGAASHPFIPGCFDASDAAVPLAQSATCQTNVPAGQSSFNITVFSTDTSAAGDGTLNLSITAGIGYAIGTTNPDHAVNIIAPPGLSYQSANAFVLGSNGGQLRAGLLLSETVPAGESLTVRWAYFDAGDSGSLAEAGFVIPTATRCFTISGGVETVIPNTGATTIGTCESVVPGGANSVEITLNSAADSSAGGVMRLELIDGIGYAPPADNEFRFVSLLDIDIAAATRAISQFNGYYAAIAFDLEEPISARTTGTLTVSFNSGVLDTAVSGVDGEGDFTCNAADNRCEYAFNADDVGDADDVGETSLSLVLSVSIDDTPPTQVTMTLSGSALGYNVVGGEGERITLSRANYLVDLAAGAIPDLIEGSAPLAFNVDITPRPVVGLTVTLRFRNASAFEIIQAADIAIARLAFNPPAGSDIPATPAAPVTCSEANLGTSAIPNHVLFCTLIVPPDGRVTDLATPSETYQPQFSIAALADTAVEPVLGINAIFSPPAPIPGPGGYVAGPDADEFFINPRRRAGCRICQYARRRQRSAGRRRRRGNSAGIVGAGSGRRIPGHSVVIYYRRSPRLMIRIRLMMMPSRFRLFLTALTLPASRGRLCSAAACANSEWRDFRTPLSLQSIPPKIRIYRITPPPVRRP